jgi:hypothetical protein
MELADTPKFFTQTFKTTGTSSIYELDYAPVLATSLVITLDGDVVPDEPVVGNATSGVAVEETTGKLMFDFVPAADLDLVVTGTYFRFFTDKELESIVGDSFAMHTSGRTDTNGRSITLGRLGAIEEYPLALLGTINALYVLATDASFDIDISAPDGVNIPRSQRYRQLMELIEELKARYKELSMALNIGLYKIEVYTLRRISKRTNRYVPIYRPQEIDDRSRPVRVHLPMPTYGDVIVENDDAVFDFTAGQGATFSRTVTKTLNGVPLDLTGATAKMQLRSYYGDPVAALTLTETDGLTLGGTAGTIQIQIGPATLSALSARQYVYDLEVYAIDGSTIRLLEGVFVVTPEVTR